MSTTKLVEAIDRRAFVVGTAKASLLLAALGVPHVGLAAWDGRVSTQFEAAYREIIKGAKPQAGLISLTLPSHFDNGHAVPFSIFVASPMIETSYIKAIHMVSTANPIGKIATFHLSPRSGEAIVSGRFRLAKSQDVYVLAERSDGSLFVAKQLVNVKVGGCS